MDSIKISTSLLNEVLAYLGKRPYEEVFQHVTRIQQEAQSFIQQAESEAKSLATKAESEAKSIVSKIVDAIDPPAESTVPTPDFPPAE